MIINDNNIYATYIQFRIQIFIDLDFEVFNRGQLHKKYFAIQSGYVIYCIMSSYNVCDTYSITIYVSHIQSILYILNTYTI